MFNHILQYVDLVQSINQLVAVFFKLGRTKKIDLEPVNLWKKNTKELEILEY